MKQFLGKAAAVLVISAAVMVGASAVTAAASTDMTHNPPPTAVATIHN